MYSVDWVILNCAGAGSGQITQSIEKSGHGSFRRITAAAIVTLGGRTRPYDIARGNICCPDGIVEE